MIPQRLYRLVYIVWPIHLATNVRDLSDMHFPKLLSTESSTSIIAGWDSQVVMNNMCSSWVIKYDCLHLLGWNIMCLHTLSQQPTFFGNGLKHFVPFEHVVLISEHIFLLNEVIFEIITSPESIISLPSYNADGRVIPSKWWAESFEEQLNQILANYNCLLDFRIMHIHSSRVHSTNQSSKGWNGDFYWECIQAINKIQ